MSGYSLNGLRVAQQDIRTHAIPPGSYVRIEVPPIEECRQEEVSLLQLEVSQRISFRFVDDLSDGPFPLELSSEMRFEDDAANFVTRSNISRDQASFRRSGWR